MAIPVASAAAARRLSRARGGAAARRRRRGADVEVCEGRVLRRAAAAPEQNRRPDRDSGAARRRGPTSCEG
jgi:hypothetical protein